MLPSLRWALIPGSAPEPDTHRPSLPCASRRIWAGPSPPPRDLTSGPLQRRELHEGKLCRQGANTLRLGPLARPASLPCASGVGASGPETRTVRLVPKDGREGETTEN